MSALLDQALLHLFYHSFPPLAITISFSPAPFTLQYLVLTFPFLYCLFLSSMKHSASRRREFINEELTTLCLILTHSFYFTNYLTCTGHSPLCQNLCYITKRWEKKKISKHKKENKFFLHLKFNYGWQIHDILSAFNCV